MSSRTWTALAVTALIGAGLAVPAAASTSRTANVEVLTLQKINGGRSGVGKAALVMHAGLRTKAREHSAYMIGRGGLSHDGFSTRVTSAAPDPYESNGPPDDGFRSLYSGATYACENVAYMGGGSPTDDQIAQTFYDLWYRSTSGHKECMLDLHSNGYTVAGVGVGYDS
ncbi:MAG TPA: CAP domain-containing protein, partial [Actinomycetota bacterium]|nr:CAP domain-containing protein [Actinomycetota bacterium]